MFFTISKRANKKVVVEDDALIPERYLKIKTEVDTTALKNDLLNGVAVSGASIEINESITIK